MIHLTGAGCDNWKLLALHAMRVIQEADYILYDCLLDPEILTFAPRHCDCIYVGKETGKHAIAQEEIQCLMVERTARLDTVIRFKGGDPCMFGHAGEGAQALAQARIPFGITSSTSSGIGGLAFAGIPITHRDYVSDARLMSAHDKASAVNDLDYAGMVRTRDTLISYVGLQQLSAIVSGLMQAEYNPNAPIALVSNAGHVAQMMVTATLEDIEDRDFSAIVSPTLVVIGGVTNLQKELNFMKWHPLSQKRYLLPQFTDARRGPQLELQDLGTAVDCITTGRICADSVLLDNVNLQETDILAFPSHNAIEISFIRLVQRRQDVRQLSTVKIAVVGEESRQVLARYGIQADIQPQQGDSEHLALELQKRIPENNRLVFMGADNDNRALFKQLQEHAHVSLCKAYTMQELPFDPPQHIYDGALFTCNFHVHACLGRLMERQDVTELKVHSMGTRIIRALRSYGCQRIIELPKADRGLFGTCIIEEGAYV